MSPIDEERDGMNKGPSSFPTDLRSFVHGERWTYAKTMPAWPHEYLVRGRVDQQMFEALVTHIRSQGYEGRFYGKTIIYYEEDGLGVLDDGSAPSGDDDNQPM